MDGFRHDKVKMAVSELTNLRAAGGKVGAPDPVPQLERIDCDPKELDTQAGDVGEHAKALEDRRGQVDAVLKSVIAAWQVDGEVADYVHAAFSALQAFGEGVSARLEATKEACEQVVADLDETARGVAKDAQKKVDDTEAECRIVLSPELYGATEEEYEKAKKKVRDACNGIRKSVDEAIDKISDKDGPKELKKLTKEYVPG